MGGVFFVKSGPFLNAGCVMYSISIFYFIFYLFKECVRTQRTPLPTGLTTFLHSYLSTRILYTVRTRSRHEKLHVYRQNGLQFLLVATALKQQIFKKIILSTEAGCHIYTSQRRAVCLKCKSQLHVCMK